MATTLTDPLLGHLVDGRYEVLSRIARGGMATVYLAIDRRLDREVALKVMHPHLAEGTSGADFIARFRREARASARLTHPGLVAVLDQGVDGETSYLAMEYVDGSTLRRRLADEGSLTVGDALKTAESVLEALAVAHRAGLVHRDVKPENVLLATDGRVKVADFGLARAVTEVTMTATGTVLGTVAYLAPELVAHGLSDARTDVYAVGILLYEMITGRQPFTGETPIQVAYQHVHSDIPAPSDALDWLPAEVDELVQALAAREPTDRPADAAAALQVVRRTQVALDDAVLSRRAATSPPAATSPDDEDDDDPDVTESLSVPHPSRSEETDEPMRRTIALRIGTGLEPEPPAPLPRRRRRRAVLLSLLLVLLVAGGAAAWFGLGPGAYTTVPSGVVGVSLEDATAVLTEAGLEATSTTVFDPRVAVGLVVTAAPAEGGRIEKGGTVGLAVSKGPDMRTVPDALVGAPVADATAALEQAGFAVPEPTRAYDDAVPADHVIAMSAEGGSALPVDTEVTLTVSDGPAPLTIITVVGLGRDDAVQKLTDQGLAFAEAPPQYSEEFAAGMVMAQDPAPDTAGHRTDTVTITVSQGPPLVQVPDVFRWNYGDAKSLLEGLGFVVERKASQDGDFANEVRQQSIDPGEMVPKGSTIVLTVV